MTDTTDPYAWYHAALAAKKNGVLDVFMKTPEGSFQEDGPKPGYYRNRGQDGALKAVAFWIQHGEMQCQVNNEVKHPKSHGKIWIYAADNPIDEDVYISFMNSGVWPDVSIVAAADREAAKSTNPDIPASDSIEGLTKRLEALEKEAAALVAAGPAKTKQEADVAADVGNTIAALAKTLDAKRKAEKRPHQDAGTEVDRKWNPLIARTEIYRDIKRVRVDPWLTAENLRRSIEASKQLADRLAMQELARIANTPLPVAPPPPIEVKAASAGTVGRKIHQQAVWTATITDRDAFLAHVKDHFLITGALDTIAKALAKSEERPVTPGIAYVEGTRSV